MGYVYVMGASEFVKIGITENDVVRRKDALQTGCPFPIENIWQSNSIDNYRQCESRLHQIFRQYNTSGEWFKAGYSKVCAQADIVIRMMNMRGDTIMDGIYYQRMVITPEMASRYLETNTRNRTLKPEKIQKIVSDIKNGQWHMNHQAIAFDENGCLIDGQHRLTAIVQSDIPCEVMVAFNAPKSAKIDDIATRSEKDRLYMSGVIEKDSVEYYPLTLPLISYIMSRSIGSKFKCATETQKHQIYLKYQDDIDFVVNETKHMKAKGRMRSAPILYAILCARMAGVPDDVLNKWHRIATTGDFYVEGDDLLTRCGRSITLFRDFIDLHGRASDMAEKEIVMKKAMSSIRWYASKKPISKLYGELVYPEIDITDCECI